MIHYLHVIQLSKFKIFHTIHLGITELRSLARSWEPFARKHIKSLFLKTEQLIILETA
jgi:hypothetical protein